MDTSELLVNKFLCLNFWWGSDVLLAIFNYSYVEKLLSKNEEIVCK